MPRSQCETLVASGPKKMEPSENAGFPEERPSFRPSFAGQSWPSRRRVGICKSRYAGKSASPRASTTVRIRFFITKPTCPSLSSKPKTISIHWLRHAVGTRLCRSAGYSMRIAQPIKEVVLCSCHVSLLFSGGNCERTQDSCVQERTRVAS